MSLNFQVPMDYIKSFERGVFLIIKSQNLILNLYQMNSVKAIMAMDKIKQSGQTSLKAVAVMWRRQNSV